MLTPDEEDTLVALSQTRAQLHNQLTKIEFDDKKHDAAVNSISLIIRTLDKIDQMTRTLRQEQLLTAENLRQEDHDKLREKVKILILQGVRSEAEKGTKYETFF